MSIDLPFRLIVAALLAVGIAFRQGLDTFYGIELIRYPKSKLRACLAILLLQVAGIPIFPINFGSESTEITTRSIGIGLAAIGFIGFLWARWVRGRTWAYIGHELLESTGHDLITAGPYKFERHPAYVAQVIGAVGLELTLGSWLVLLSIAVFWKFRQAAKQEQFALLDQYGNAYYFYLRRTCTLLFLSP